MIKDCSVCIHCEGLCNCKINKVKRKCFLYSKFEPNEKLLAHNKELKNGFIDEILDHIDAGLCDVCEHNYDGCYKICGQAGYEKEALIKWLKEQKNE